MPDLARDLFPLMLRLSRMRDRGRMVRLLVDALSDVRSGVAVRPLAAGEESAGEIVELATPGASFGRLAVEGPLGSEDRALFRNAILVLAVLLENVSREERLATENARLDAAVAVRTVELERTLSEVRDLYEHAPFGYHSVGADGTIVRMNETELRWLGYAREEIVGRTKLGALLTPASRAIFERCFPAFRARGSTLELELELVRKDGSVLPVLCGATAVRDALGALRVCRATVIDVTDRRRVEEQLRQAQKLEAIGRLAGGVAHDFNNLLTVILSASAALREGLRDAPLREEALEIEDAARRAAAMTRQLLTFGRRQRVEPKVLELGEVIARLDRMLRRLIPEDVELVTVTHPGLRRIRGDPGQIEQVIVNLVVNARDALPAGGCITIETRNVQLGPAEARDLGLAPGEHALLSIADTGSGMGTQVLSHLFEPFFTTKEAGKGTGLGLSTVYGIVKECGGEIRVKTAPGEGTTFRVYLPAAGEDASGREDAEAERLARGSGRVLLVEDEPAVRRLALRALRDAGYTVVDAGDGEEALRLADGGGEIDVLVTDVVMPRVGGRELAERIRARRPGVKVLLVSGYTGEPWGVTPGPGVAFLTKPFTPAALSRSVRELLGASPR